VRAASGTLAVISEKGRKLKDFPIEIHNRALVEAARMISGHKRLVMEEGLQSAWLYEALSPHADELEVAGITQCRGRKSDKRTATPSPRSEASATSTSTSSRRIAATPLHHLNSAQWGTPAQAGAASNVRYRHQSARRSTR
jgi:hypothetical protein